MKHWEVNSFSATCNCCSRVGKQHQANLCLEAEDLGLNKNMQPRRSFGCGEKFKTKNSLQSKKESEEQQKANWSQNRRWRVRAPHSWWLPAQLAKTVQLGNMGKQQTSRKWSHNDAAELCFSWFRSWIGMVQKCKNRTWTLRSGMCIHFSSIVYAVVYATLNHK